MLQDSERARERIAALINSFKDADGLASYLISEMGIDIAAPFIAWAPAIRCRGSPTEI